MIINPQKFPKVLKNCSNKLKILRRSSAEEKIWHLQMGSVRTLELQLKLVRNQGDKF